MIIRIHSVLTRLYVTLNAFPMYYITYVYSSHVPFSQLKIYNMPYYTAQWSRDLEIDLEAEDWDDIWATTKSSSQNIIQ